MKHYEHKFGKWQPQAQYANGQPDPNAPRNTSQSSDKKRKVVFRSKTSAEKEAERAEKRRAKQQAKNQRKAQKAQKKAYKEKRKKEAAAAEEERKLNEIREKCKNNPELFLKNIDKFSTQEIQAAYSRFDATQKIKDIKARNTESQAKTVQNVVNMMANARVGWDIFASAYNSFAGGDLPLLNANARNQQREERRANRQEEQQQRRDQWQEEAEMREHQRQEQERRQQEQEEERRRREERRHRS